ncbi:MAG: lysophospholipid acyltransferase family protein, partial [Planctomycetota bacterium]|nr:lysophospholipid acyltransferase family protein [Planctomycetota bacterium]
TGSNKKGVHPVRNEGEGRCMTERGYIFISNGVKKITSYIEYFLLRTVISFLLTFPLQYSLALSRLIGNLFYYIPNKFTRRALGHLKIGYPNRNPAELSEILKKTLEHFAMMLVELVSFPRKIRLYNYKNYIEIKGLNHIDECLKNNKGVLLVAAHFGNWELSGYVLSMLGYPLNAVARFMPNELVDKLLNYSRKYYGQKIIYNENAIREMLKVLKKNKILALVCDQDARDSGVFVDFMGVKSSTVRSPAMLHMKFATPLIMLSCYRSRADKFYYTLSFEPCPLPSRLTGRQFGQDSRTDISAEEITQAFTSQIEKAIRARPEQWLWFHRRWKTRA